MKYNYSHFHRYGVGKNHLKRKERNKKFRGCSVLITGITGFVGPYLAKSLLNDGAEVFGLVRRRSDGNLKRGLEELGIEKQVGTIEGSVEDLTSLLNALDKSQPDYVFHLAAQSFVERSFVNPIETFQTNATGTTNLLEAMRIKDRQGSRLVFSGSSEEYGLVISSREHLNQYLQSHSRLFPYPARIPELPIAETNPLRPMSPYAVTKVYGEYITLNYHRSYGLDVVVSRGFNHEGARRGASFVTSTIARQVVLHKYRLIDTIKIGNVNAFRDWSSVRDIVSGYKLLALRGSKGDVYNLGSERTNSVLTYLLWALETSGSLPTQMETKTGDKKVVNPSSKIRLKRFGMEFDGSNADELLLDGRLEFYPSDEMLNIKTSKGVVRVEFDLNRFRPADVPLLLSDTSKVRNALGYEPSDGLRDIIVDQLNYYEAPGRRKD